MKKLRNNRGETLLEGLIAVMIAALSMTMLLSCVTASSHTGTGAKEMDDKFYQTLSDVEGHSGTNIPSEEVTITNKEGATAAAPTTVSVTVYGDGGLYSYSK